jgi:quercetin dioxygenase-like cupin family protein
MALRKKSTKSPDETRPFVDRGKVEIFNLGDQVVAVGTFEPGWKWSEHVKPIAKTDSCQSSHFGYVLSGRMRIKSNDGAEEEFGPGDIMLVEPGHDAWVIGSETCKVVDFAIIPTYAKH